MKHGSSLAAAFCVVGALAIGALAGCGSGDEETSTTTSTKTVELRPSESADPLPKLARGWVAVRSKSANFALGRPPGWEPRHKGSSLTILAPDRLVAVTVAANRSPSGLAIPAARFASRAASSLKGYDGKLEPSKARPFRHRYSAFQTVDRARSKGGVPQEIRVIVMRRPRLVTFTAVIARNANRPDAEESKQALEIVRTIRSGSGTERPKKGKTLKDEKAGEHPSKKDAGAKKN